MRGMGDTVVHLDIAGEEARYRGPALIALYRAAQEGLTNVRKHAAARSVSVRLELGDAEAQLCVADDGQGFVPSTVDDGFGLLGMRERLELVGGSVTVDSSPGGGTRLRIRVPVPA